MKILAPPVSRAPARIPSGPQGNLIMGNAMDLQRNILDFVTDVHRNYGSPARVRLLPNYYGYLLSDPANYKHILQENAATYSKEVLHFDILSLLIGRSVVTLNGNLWKRRRKMAQPAFHRQRINALTTTMTDITARMLTEWDAAPENNIVDIEAEMTRLTLRIASKTLLNVEFEGDFDSVGLAFAEVNKFMSSRWVNPFALWTAKIPTPGNRGYRDAMRTLDQAVYGIIAERRRTGEDPGDLLSMLLAATDENTGETLDDLELRDEVMTILIAGHETSSTALTWTWYLLSQNPEAEEKLHRELKTVLNGRMPTVEDLKSLPYTAMVFSEAMRLYPPAYVIGRKALLEDRIDGNEIPRGANLYLVPWVTHRREDLWDRPLDFDPERFTDERSAGRPQYAYVPFGGGPRRCIGDSFAETESRLILAAVAQKYRPVLCADQKVDPKPLVTIRPRYGMRMRLERRD
jgi:cytochrome P450